MPISESVPRLTHRREGGFDIPILVWRFRPARLMIASGPLGGGLGQRDWLINASVPMAYDRDDPDRHLAEIGVGLGLTGQGAGLLTGVDVSRRVMTSDAGAGVVATVGIGAPIMAADVASATDREPAARSPVGTINIVAEVPVRLSPAALVNAVATITEAKVQALRDLAIEGTGTCTDAICLSCPIDGPAEPYGGPRSTWGARLARATYAAVRSGGADWLAAPRSWSCQAQESAS